MIGYIKAEAAAKRWDVSLRHVQRLCIEGFIKGAVKFANAWLFPKILSSRLFMHRRMVGYVL
jgi:hypothetical protein